MKINSSSFLKYDMSAHHLAVNPERATSAHQTETKRGKIFRGYEKMGENQTEMNEWLLITNDPSNL